LKLERELDSTIHDWMALVEKDPELSRVPLDYKERTGYPPKLLHDVIAGLRLDKGTKAPISVAAGHHGDLRRKQGYAVAMVVDESRILQASIFAGGCHYARGQRRDKTKGQSRRNDLECAGDYFQSFQSV
jgi:hypothetical protein